MKLLLCLTLLLISCGESPADQCNVGMTLVGDWTQEEATALSTVTSALNDLGYFPSVWVNFVRSPDKEFRNTTWANFRVGVEPRNPSEGYRGYFDREFCMILVRRYGEAEPFLYELLVHELLHAVGMNHGDKMRQAERDVISLVRSGF